MSNYAIVIGIKDIFLNKNEKEYDKLFEAGKKRLWNTNTHYHS